VRTSPARRRRSPGPGTAGLVSGPRMAEDGARGELCAPAQHARRWWSCANMSRSRARRSTRRCGRPGARVRKPSASSVGRPRRRRRRGSVSRRLPPRPPPRSPQVEMFRVPPPSLPVPAVHEVARRGRGRPRTPGAAGDLVGGLALRAQRRGRRRSARAFRPPAMISRTTCASARERLSVDEPGDRVLMAFETPSDTGLAVDDARTPPVRLSPGAGRRAVCAGRRATGTAVCSTAAGGGVRPAPDGRPLR
jgi:hypothetical protein